jgi:glucose-6-phosphate dehydrogenase assembly protein OpcA
MGAAGTIAPEKILRELAEMWTALNKDAGGETDSALRACTLTLITLAEENEDFGAIGEAIAALMPQHPARTILVRLQGPGERQLSNRVYSQCWRPFGQKRQVCCEQVEIVASDKALSELPAVILPLTVADLPVILWCRSPRAACLPAFPAIAAMASRVIIDGEAFCSQATAGAKSKEQTAQIAMQRIAAIATKDTAVGDLAWTRLTGWRAMLSQIFENRQNLAALPGVTKVTVTAGGEPRVGAWYFAAWVMDSLADIGVHPDFRMEGKAAASNQDLQSIRLEGPRWSAELSREGERFVATVNGVSQSSSLGRATDYSMMEEELRITERDPTFERALVTAQRMTEERK